MENLSYAEFLRKIDGKNLALLQAGFYQNSIQKYKILDFFESEETDNMIPVNSGIVTVRSKDFFRTLPDGKQSYASKIINTKYIQKNEYFLLLSPVNFIIYKVLA